MEVAIVISNVGIILVSLMLVAVDWHSDNAIVTIVKTLNPFTPTPPKHDHHHREDDSK